uniref:VPS37D subunit of ESCRT-I n=1 Tax=Catharus ustulatus TaxID=91951 RepID=A0A8C3UKL6_CATUS
MQRAECRIRVAGAGCAQGYRMRTAGAGCAQRVQGALMGCRVTAQLRALLQDEPRLQRAARLSRKEQIKQFLTQELPLESFLESFCQSRTQSHICRTQLEKLQELLQKEQLQKDQVGRDPAVVPFPVPAAPPKHRLPALGQQPASPCSETPSPGSPLRLVGHIPLLSPQPGRGQEQPQHQNQEPPHR